jgi:hypothetical protein
METSYSSIFDYANDWPAAFYVSSNDSVRIHSCPNSMHQVIWGQNDTIIIHLFPKSLSSNLNPLFEVDSESLHYPVYQVSAFSTSNVTGKRVQPIDVVLTPGQYLFVPEIFLTSLGSTSDQTISCLRMCFVDASNLKSFRTDLLLDSKISEYARDVLNFFNSRNIHLKMSKSPKDFYIRKFSHVMEQLGNQKFVVEDESSESDAETGSRNKKSSEKFKGLNYIFHHFRHIIIIFPFSIQSGKS